METTSLSVLLIVLLGSLTQARATDDNEIDKGWFLGPLIAPQDIGSEPPQLGLSKVSEVEDGCACKQILISSLLEAQHVQANSMGTFKYYSQYNGKPYYYSYGHNMYLYFLNGSGWLIGGKVGAPTGFIHNSALYACPYMIPEGWMYVNNGYWYKDLSLVVRCIP